MFSFLEIFSENALKIQKMSLVRNKLCKFSGKACPHTTIVCMDEGAQLSTGSVKQISHTPLGNGSLIEERRTSHQDAIYLDKLIFTCNYNDITKEQMKSLKKSKINWIDWPQKIKQNKSVSM